MPFKFQCLCGQRYAARPNLIGKTMSCKRCRLRVVIPSPDHHSELPRAGLCKPGGMNGNGRGRRAADAGRRPSKRTEGCPPRQEAEPGGLLGSTEGSSSNGLRSGSGENALGNMNSEFVTPPQGLEQALTDLQEFALDVKEMHQERGPAQPARTDSQRHLDLERTETYGHGEELLLVTPRTQA